MIVSSRGDPASWNIAQALITKIGFEQEPGQRIETYSKGNIRMLVLDKLGIYTEPSEIPSDVVTTIFVSKHVSSSGRAALTVHTTGNLTKEAKFGGNPEEVSYVNPSIIRRALRVSRQGWRKQGSRSR
jgi:D-tyrosyl-tRNA(Tyr) deacylase